MTSTEQNVNTTHPLFAEVDRIAREIAGPAASDVDIHSRFPQEAIEALKKARALSCGVPVELGGYGLNIWEQGQLCIRLSEYCASASMVLGMHLIKVASLVHHGKGSQLHEDYLRDIANEQRLVASVTSEEGIGGNLRNSITAVEVDGDRFKLVKESTCLSYGAYADDMLLTCRRNSDSPPSDQVVVLAKRGDFKLEQKGEWDAMGMRGTCSPPFTVTVEGPAWQVFDAPFADIAARTMVPETHIIWSCIWFGIAVNAVARARALLQAKARKNPEITDAARKLALVSGKLQMTRNDIENVTREYMAAHESDDVGKLTSVDFSLRINNLKVNSSESVRDIVADAMEITGFLGYLNNTEYSVARHLRDAYSAAPMIGNGRLIDTNAMLSLVHKADDGR